jgi:hypothetical protein
MSAAERQQRRRVREAMGLIVLPVEADADILTELIAAGLLREAAAADRSAAAVAAANALRQWAADHLASRVTRVTGARR